MRCELVNGLLLFIENGVLSALELLIVKVLRRLLACRVCALPAWRYLSTKTDTPPPCGYSPGTPHSGYAHLRLSSGTSCIIPSLSPRTLNGNHRLEPDLDVFLVPTGDPWPVVGRHISLASVPFTWSPVQYTLIWVPSARYVPICPGIRHPFRANSIDRAP